MTKARNPQSGASLCGDPCVENRTSRHLLSRCCLMTGLSILNYILVYVARTPNHQNPDHEVKYQRQEDFHRIVSHPVIRQSKIA